MLKFSKYIYCLILFEKTEWEPGILSLSPRDEYGNTYPPYEGEYSILTLPVRESIEILPLSVRVSIGMFSAHIKEYGTYLYVRGGWVWKYLTSP